MLDPKKIREEMNRRNNFDPLSKTVYGGKPSSPEDVAAEDEEVRMAKAARKREENPESDRQSGESDQEYAIRMEKNLRRKLTGAEVMERDRIFAEMRNRERLSKEPFIAAEIVEVMPDSRTPREMLVVVKLDTSHPSCSDELRQSGKLILQARDCRQLLSVDEDGSREFGRPQLKVGLRGHIEVSLSPRDGHTPIYQFIIAAS